MTTLEKIRDEIAEYGSIWVQYYIKGHTDTDIDKLVEDVLQQAKSQVLAVIDKYAEQEPTDEWQNGYDMAWELAEVFYEQEPCEDAYDKVLVYLKANVDDFPDYHEAIEAVLKMKGGE